MIKFTTFSYISNDSRLLTGHKKSLTCSQRNKDDISPREQLSVFLADEFSLNAYVLTSSKFLNNLLNLNWIVKLGMILKLELKY